jgi:hypothetical protein
MGLGPLAELSPAEDALAAIRAGSADAREIIDARLSSGPFLDGWTVPDPAVGTAGPHILSRVANQISQIGSFPAAEAVYFFAHLDKDDNPLFGANRYGHTFASDTFPPPDDLGFWSVTMYSSRALLVDSFLNRYILRPVSPGLTYGADGSLTPKGAIRSEDWFPPGIERVG